jgi:hypothetical protein
MNVVIGLVGAVPSALSRRAGAPTRIVPTVGLSEGSSQTEISLVEATLRPSRPVVPGCSTSSGWRPRFPSRISLPLPPEDTPSSYGKMSAMHLLRPLVHP